MKYISLFAGIGCADVAWQPLGWEPLAFSEIDPFASAVLAARFPGVPNIGDVTSHDWRQYRGQCDLVIGGSPCQPYSVAGLRQSLDDPRGQLTLAFVRAVNEIDPPWTVWENVPGVLSCDRDNPFGCFLAGMAGASEPIVPGTPNGRWPDAGLVVGPERAAAWGILDSQHFGVPQRRRRVFLVAVRLSHPAFALGKTPNPAAVLSFPPGGLGHPAKGGQAGQEAVAPAGGRAPCGGESPACEPPANGLRPTANGTATAPEIRAVPPAVTGPICADSFTGGAGGRPDGAAGNHFIPCGGDGRARPWPAEIAPTLDASFANTNGIDNQHIDGGAGLFALGGDGLPEVAGTLITASLTGGLGGRGNVHGHVIPVTPDDGGPAAAVTAKWAKGSGGPAGDEAQNLVAVPVEIGPSGGKEAEVAPTLDTRAKDGPVRSQVGAAVVQGVAYPLLEIGKRGGPGNDRAGSGSGIGEDGDPMYTLQAGAKHGVVEGIPVAFHLTQDPIESVGATHALACGSTKGQASVAVAMPKEEEAVPLDIRNATRDRRPDGKEPGGGVSAKEGDPAFTVTSGGAVQAVAFSSKNGGGEGRVSPTLRAMGHDGSHANGGGPVAAAIRLAGPPASSGGAPDDAVHIPDSTGPETARRRRDGAGQPMAPVASTGAGAVEVSPTIRAHTGSPRPEKATDAVVVDSLAVRRLTPRECERLMGLPDDWTLIPYGRGRKRKDLAEMAAYWGVSPEAARTLAADSLRYRSIGNGMAVPVVWWIGKRIEWVMERLA